MTRSRIASTLACLALAASASHAGDPAGRPDFTGRWTFNAEKSDDARAKLRAAADGGRRGEFGGPGRGGPMGGGLPPGGGRGGPMGGMGGGPPVADMEAMRAAMDDVLEPAAALTVTQGDPELIAVRDDGRVLRLYTDGRKAKERNGTVERKTRWDGSRLVSEVKLQDGRKLTEVWILAADGRELRSSVKLELGRGELVVDRVYDLAPPE
jgi:hypothetical protein